MSGHFMGASPRALQGGAVAAATVLAGAGLFGVAAVGPEISGAPLAPASHSVALTAFPTFAESLQNLLDAMHLGTVNELLATLGAVPGDPNTDFSANSTVGQLLASLNPTGLTLGQVFGQFGIPLGDPLYSTTGESLLGSANFVINGQTVDNPFVFDAPASFYTVNPNDTYASINGTPLGAVDLGKLVDLLLGGAGEGDTHSLADLASAVNFDLNQQLPSFGPLSGVFSFFTGVNTYADAINKLGGTLSDFNEIWRGQGALGSYGPWVHDVLNANSSLNDWLSGILGMPTTDVNETTYKVLSVLAVAPSAYVFTGGTSPLGVGSDADASQLSATTLGQYLQTVPWGATANTFLGSQSLGALLNMDPSETWNAYLSSMLFGGTFFHPGTDTLGSQTIGEMLLSWLPNGGSGFDLEGGDAPVTSLLEAFGLLNW